MSSRLTFLMFPRLIFSVVYASLVFPRLPLPGVSTLAQYLHAIHCLVSPRLTFPVFPNPPDISTPGLPSVSMPSTAWCLHACMGIFPCLNCLKFLHLLGIFMLDLPSVSRHMQVAKVMIDQAHKSKQSKQMKISVCLGFDC